MSNDINTRKDMVARRPATGVAGILPHLFDTIKFDLNYNHYTLVHRCKVYCAKLRNVMIPSGKTTHASAAAVLRDISADRMTIKTFITALRVIDIPKVEISVTLFHVHRPPTVHSVMVNLRDVTPEDLETDEPPPNLPLPEEMKDNVQFPPLTTPSPVPVGDGRDFRTF
jgi:hypothetical protein